MPAGRKTQTFATDTSGSARKANAYQEVRGLGGDLHGVIFGCKNSTYYECINKMLFGLPENPHWSYVQHIAKGMHLFLFNYETRMLHGVFEAAGQGDLYIDCHAWTGGDKGTKYAAQVRVKWVQECSPIPERVFKSAIGKNYFNVNKFMHELDKQQVDDLLHLMLGRKSGREPPQPDRTTFQREQHNGTGRIHQGRGVARAMEPQQANEPPRGAWGRPPPSVTTMQGGSSSFSQSTGWDYHQKPTQQSPPPFTPSGRNIPDSEIKPAGWGSPPKGKPQSSSAPASQSGMNDSDFVVVPTGWGSPPKSRSQSPPYDQDQRNQSNRLAGLKEKEKLGWEDRSNGWNAREPCYAAKPRPRIQEAFGEWKGNGRSESVKVKVEPSESSCPCQSHRSFDSSSTGSGGSSGNRGKREGKQKGKGFVKEEFPQGGWKDHTQRQTDNRQLALDEETAKVFERLAVADQPLADALQNVLELSKTSVQQALHEAAEARQALETEWKGKVQSIDAEWNEKIRKMDLERLRMERSFQDEVQTLRDEVQDLRQKLKIIQFAEAGREGAVSLQVMVARDVTEERDANEMVGHWDSNREALVEKTSLSDVAGDIYLMGGFHDHNWLASVEVFNPLLRKWRNVAPMGDPRSYAAASVLDRKIFVFGGGSAKDLWYDTVEMYNPHNDKWIPVCALNQKRGSLGGAVLSGKIYAVGGGCGEVTSDVDPFAVCEILDPHVGRWVFGNPMQEKRYCVAMAEHGGALYALGGFNNDGYMSSAERFDPREGSWQHIPSMSEKRGSLSAAVANGKIYAIGGFDNSPGNPSAPQFKLHNSVEAFDPRADRWLQVPPMKFTRAYGAAAVIGNAIYCMGGGPAGVHLIEKYTEENGWQIVQPLGNHQFQKNSFLTAAVL